MPAQATLSPSPPTIAIINGPNLNLLGSREPHIYGNVTLTDICKRLEEQATEYQIKLDCFQSNAEHELIDYVQKAKLKAIDFIIINAAAFTHTSLALADAVHAIAIPYIEIHISNTYSRERFRHHSYLSAKAYGIINGLGHYGYDLALQAARNYLSSCEEIAKNPFRSLSQY